MKTIIQLTHATHFAVIAATVALLLAAAPARADEGSSCHFHGNKPASVETVTGCATQRLALMVKQGRLDASWQAIKPKAPEQVEGKKGKEWKLSIHNPAAADKAKQTLYMFYTPSGNYIAANFTGQ